MKKLFCFIGLVGLVGYLAVGQTLTGKLEDNKLAGRTGTFYVNMPPEMTPPDNLNNGNSESIGVAIAANGNVIIGWEDDGDALTDFEAVWSLYSPGGDSITPNVDIGSQDPNYAGLTINSKFMSYFRADKSPMSGRVGWGPKIKANLFGTGFGMGSTAFDIGLEAAEWAGFQDAGDYPMVQLMTDSAVPIGIVPGLSQAYCADAAGSNVRIGDWDYLANGNIVVVSESRQNADLVNLYGGAAEGNHVVYRIVTPAGQEVKAAALVSQNAAVSHMWHGVGVTANGFGVRFEEGGKAIVRLFDIAGTPITANIDVAALTGNVVTAAGGRGEGVGFHGNGADAYVVTASGADETGAVRVWATVLTATGTVRYSKSVATDISLAKVNRCDAAIHANGRVFVVWDATIIDDPAPALVMGRMLDGAGKPIGGTFYLSEKDEETLAGYYPSVQPRIAARGDAFAVTWLSQNSGAVDPNTGGPIKVLAGRLFGVAFDPGSIESIGLTRIVPDKLLVDEVNAQTLNANGNWEPYTSVLGTSTFLIECNTFAQDDAVNQRFVTYFQPAAGGAGRLGECFFTDAGAPYRGQINLSRQNGNPGRVAGDKRPDAVNFMTGAEISLHGWPDLFPFGGSDHGMSFVNPNARYGSVQVFKLNPTTLAQTPLSKAQDSANGRRTSGEAQGDQSTRFGGELACLDNGNFVSVVEDRSRMLRPDGDCPAATIFAPDGTVVKDTWQVADDDIWSNVCAYKGGFAIRAKTPDKTNRAIYFHDNDGTLKGWISQAATGRTLDTGRGDGTRIAGHINSPYVYLIGSVSKVVYLAVFDSRDRSFVTVMDVSEPGFVAKTDRAGVAVDALNRVTAVWEGQPADYELPQTAARVLAFNPASKTLAPLTPSFWAFINVAKTGGIRTFRMNVSMTTKQICIAAKGEINSQNKPELGTDATQSALGGQNGQQRNFFTVFTHPAPADDPTTPVGGPVTPPTLSIAKSGNNVVISWPTTATGFTLKKKAKLTDATWTTVGTANPATVAASDSAAFFRLEK